VIAAVTALAAADRGATRRASAPAPPVLVQRDVAPEDGRDACEIAPAACSPVLTASSLVVTVPLAAGLPRPANAEPAIPAAAGRAPAPSAPRVPTPPPRAA